MNTIQAEIAATRFSTAPHLILTVDGLPLDMLIAQSNPENDLILGLIPTLLPALGDAQERKTVWERIVPTPKTTTYSPLLMCPDDVDFSCSLLVAEVIAQEHIIQWQRLGWDQTSWKDLPAGVGTLVSWIENLGPFVFHREEYIKVISKFRALFEESQVPT